MSETSGSLTTDPVTVQDPCAPLTGPVLDLLASLAHDLRSPLGVVSETVGELGTDFAPQLTDEHKILLGLAQRSLRRLSRMAESLSLMVAMDSGGFELARRRLDLFAILPTAIQTATGVEPRREVRVQHDVPQTPCLIDGDTARLTQALVEVIINAIRYARTSVRVTTEFDPQRVRILVEDDGAGIAAAPRATLFRRVAPRVSRSGLGIGLSLAHDVVVGHGGTISLATSTLPPSSPDTVGAQFVIELRRASDA